MTTPLPWDVEPKSPEETVKDAVLDALANEYDYYQIVGWVDDATNEFEDLNGQG